MRQLFQKTIYGGEHDIFLFSRVECKVSVGYTQVEISRRLIRLISMMFCIKVRARSFGVVKTEMPIVKTAKMDYLPQEKIQPNFVYFLLFPETYIKMLINRCLLFILT